MTKFIQKENFRFKDWIQPGSTISWSQATSEPLTLTEMLVDQRHEVAPLSVFAGTNFSGKVSPLCADSMSFVGMGAVGINRDFLKAGVMEVLPCHLSQIPWMIRSGALKVDALLLQVSVNSNGSFSLGAVSSYLPALIENARTILVEVNEQAPWTFGSNVLDPSRIDVVLQSDRPMIQIPAKSPQPIDELIARHVKDLIPDGAILQVGIGNLPGAVMRSLRDHKNLGIHSGVIGDKVLIELIETGVVTNATKKIDQGVSVTGSLFGTDRLYRFAHMNPEIKVERVELTHNISLISQFECFVTINSALEVDLTGQVNAESIGKNYLGTIGGQTDFVRAALSTQRGRSVVALPSINESSGKSRIVSHLNGPTTTSRADADVIATEWGIAELRGKTIKQRVHAMINIAHPDQREILDRQAHELIAGF